MSLKQYFEDFGTLCYGSMMLSTNMNKAAQPTVRKPRNLR